jgi:carbon-monoxide dehydrogenase medium subunit
LASGAVLLDSERDVFRAVIGATQACPIVVDDARTIFDPVPRPGDAVRLNEKAVTGLLSHAGPTQPASARLHVTALRRAAAQALAA